MVEIDRSLSKKELSEYIAFLVDKVCEKLDEYKDYNEEYFLGLFDEFKFSLDAIYDCAMVMELNPTTDIEQYLIDRYFNDIDKGDFICKFSISPSKQEMISIIEWQLERVLFIKEEDDMGEEYINGRLDAQEMLACYIPKYFEDLGIVNNLDYCFRKIRDEIQEIFK